MKFKVLFKGLTFMWLIMSYSNSIATSTEVSDAPLNEIESRILDDLAIAQDPTHLKQLRLLKNADYQSSCPCPCEKRTELLLTYQVDETDSQSK